MRIAVAAEPIRNGAGLGTFVSDTVNALATVRPHWQFLVVASSWYTEIHELDNIRNVDICTWDNNGLRKNIAEHIPQFRGRSRLMNNLARIVPSRALRLSFGNLTEVWKSLPAFDVLWVPHFDNNQNCWPALYKPDLVKCPILLTIHDLNALHFPELWKKNPQALRNFHEKFIPFAHQSKCIITGSSFQKSAIAKYLKISTEKIFVAYIPMPIDQNLYRCQPEETRRRLLERFGISRPYAFSPLSQTAEHKNHDRLFEVWQILKRKLGKECPMLVFTIRGARQKEFENRIQSRGIEDKVVFTGLVDKSELSILYQESELVIFPSLHEEGAGYPVLEGCVVEKPVLCSRIPPILEQVERFDLGVRFFDPMDNESIVEAIQKALEEPIRVTPRTNFTLKQNLQAQRVEFAESYAKQIESIVGIQK